MRVAVTGAFGYSGRHIAKRLLDAGHSVITLTKSVQRKSPVGNAVVAFPFHFDEPDKLTEFLRGGDALINTYWVRFDHPLFTHDQAVANTKLMFSAAKGAGVRRIVHVSITHPDMNSDLPYFRGKAELEQALMGLGISYCILRPTVATTSSSPSTWTTWLLLRSRKRPAQGTKSSTRLAPRRSRIVRWW